MRKALKVIFLFQKPEWDDYRFPYYFFGIIAWLEVISLIIAFLS